MIPETNQYSYVLRVCTTEMRSLYSHSFIWPTEGMVEAPDWDPAPVCGYGLHGFLNGCGNGGNLIHWNFNAKWLVVKVLTEDIVDLKGKVKFPRGEVLFAGNRLDAIAKLEKLAPETKHMPVISAQRRVGDYGKVVVGENGIAIAGQYGIAQAGFKGKAIADYKGEATAGDHGTATAGDYGNATAGYCGTASAGARGIAQAGCHGTATAGYKGTAQAGAGGIIRIKLSEGENAPSTRGYVLSNTSITPGIHGKTVPNTPYLLEGVPILKPDTPYVVDDKGNFVEVEPLPETET